MSTSISTSESLSDTAIVIPGTPELVPAAEIAPVADQGTPVEDTPVEIVEEEVPLAVAVDDSEAVSIEDEETPLSDKPADGLKTWWWWLIAGAAGLTGKGIYDVNKRKSNKNKNKDRNDK